MKKKCSQVQETKGLVASYSAQRNEVATSQGDQTSLVASGMDLSAQEKGKTRVSLFRRHRTPTDDKSKKTKKEKKDKDAEPAEKKSWSRFFSYRSKKKKQKEREDGAEQNDTPFCAEKSIPDLSSTIPETSTAPPIQPQFSTNCEESRSLVSPVISSTDLRQEDLTGSTSLKSTIDAHDFVTPPVHGPESRSQQDIPKSFAYHSSENSSGYGNDQASERAFVQHAKSDVSYQSPTKTIRGISGASSLQLPITLLDRSPGMKQRRNQNEGEFNSKSRSGSPERVHTEQRNLSDTQFLSRSRLHITHLSNNLDAFPEASTNSASSLRSVEMDFPLELSLKGSEKRVFVGSGCSADGVNMNSERSFLDSNDYNTRPSSLCSGRDDKGLLKGDGVELRKQNDNLKRNNSAKRKSKTETSSSVNVYGATRPESDSSSEAAKSIGTQTAFLNMADATTQSTIDRRQNRPAVDRTVTSTQANQAVEIPNHAVQTQASPEDVDICPNCQALQRPCQRHRVRQINVSSSNQSASSHLDSIESYLQLLSDIHHMHDNTRELNSAAASQTETVTEPTIQQRSGPSNQSEIDSRDIVRTGAGHQSNDSNTETVRDIEPSPFVRSFRTNQERSRERASVNRGSYRKPLEKDENMKNMPVAAVRPTIRDSSAIRSSITRRSHRTSGAASSVMQRPPENPTSTQGVQTVTQHFNNVLDNQEASPTAAAEIGQTNGAASVLTPSVGDAQPRAQVDHLPDSSSDRRPWAIARDRARERVLEYMRRREQLSVTGTVRGQQNPPQNTARSQTTDNQIQNNATHTRAGTSSQTPDITSEGGIYHILGQVQDELVRIPGVLIVGVRDDRIFVTVAPSEGEQRIPDVLRVLLQHGVPTNQCEVGVLPQSLRRAITEFTDADVIERIGDHEPRALAVN